MPKTKGSNALCTVSRGLRARAWWVIRKNRVVSVISLMMTLCDGSERAAKANLRIYLRQLAQGGILRRDGRDESAAHGPSPWRYRLVRDIGPKPPVVREVENTVYDPNSGAVYPMEPLDD